MIAAPIPLTRDLLLIGGGHTHALVLRKWGMKPLAGARVTVINPGGTAPYSGMLPGHLAGHYDRSALDIDLVKLARFADARIITDHAVGLDPIAKRVFLASGRSIDFDVASFDIGITSKMPDLPGFAEHAVPAKPLGPFAARWRAFLADCTPGTVPVDVAVIGGGVAGAEVAAAFANALAGKDRAARVHLVDRAKVLSALPVSTASRLRKALAGLGVICHENTEIVEITEQAIVTATGRIEAQFICGAAGARPHPWLTETGLTLHEGFIEVNPFLESSTQDIFATGDCAHMAFAPRPKAGVYAVRQAPVLYENLRARLADRTPTQRYSPQKDYLKLISLGEKSALGNKFGQNFQGPWVWRWKDGIDQRFMEKFRDLPVMERPDPPRERSAGVAEALAGKMLCGGCGAKVGQSALMGALGAETPGDDAAALMVDGAQVIISTDHLREMVKDPYVMAEITAHHALGDLWSMGATPVAATANIILPQMKPRLSARSLHEIMTAARAVFGAAGAEIVGGHSSLGAEMTIGFTVLGRRDGPPITLGGARVGDQLLLTKPIGSGVIMAAEMAGLAEAEWVEAALRQMTRLQRDAAEILRNAHAMTDVTGFGLLGHLRNICVTSEVGAVLRARDVPVMPGALVLAEQGISSSLFEENRLMLPEVSRSPLNDLMFDPQTAGGLLAAVAPEEAGLVEALRAAGHEAALIGEITDEVGRVQLL